MERKPDSRPSFFKVLLTDFTRRLRISPLFVEKYGEILPKNIKLRTNSGETWSVEFEQMDDKTYCFTKGWNNFVVDAGLRIGEFVVFWFNVGKSTFDVSVYGYSCCERQISSRRGSLVGASDSDENVKLNKHPTPVNNDFGEVGNNKQSRSYAVGKKARNDDTQENDYTSEDGTQENDYTSEYDTEENGYTSDEEARPQFNICLTKNNKSRVRVGNNFAVAAGLTSKKEVVLQYPPKQCSWPVKLIHYKNYSQFRLDMAKGWGEFRTKNGLVYGETYVFEYIREKKVIEVKLLD